jgi:molybdopterin-guanine dinucleotide biosynthesis protein B
MNSLRVLGIVGWSGSGKTTLIEKLLPELARLGLKVSVIKHSHHEVEFEPKGKDSARFKAAGASEVLLATPSGFILQSRAPQPPSLNELLPRLAGVDLVLVEGFKSAAIAKLEVRRAGLPVLNDPHIIAIASDQPFSGSLPVLDLNQAAAIAAFISDLPCSILTPPSAV